MTFFISLQLECIDLTNVLVIFPSTLISEKMLFFISSSGTLVCKRSASCRYFEPMCPCHNSHGPPLISAFRVAYIVSSRLASSQAMTSGTWDPHSIRTENKFLTNSTASYKSTPASPPQARRTALDFR